MSLSKGFTLSTIALAAMMGGISLAHADMYSDRLKAEQSAKSKAQTQQRLIDEPEFTGSIRPPMTPEGMPTCSYDTFYWNTIYACDPAHQGLPDYKD
jgi:hypothetical protein